MEHDDERDAKTMINQMIMCGTELCHFLEIYLRTDSNGLIKNVNPSNALTLNSQAIFFSLYLAARHRKSNSYGYVSFAVDFKYLADKTITQAFVRFCLAHFFPPFECCVCIYICYRSFEAR